jgi:hypothetical protein
VAEGSGESTETIALIFWKEEFGFDQQKKTEHVCARRCVADGVRKQRDGDGLSLDRGRDS